MKYRMGEIKTFRDNITIVGQIFSGRRGSEAFLLTEFQKNLVFVVHEMQCQVFA